MAYIDYYKILGVNKDASQEAPVSSRGNIASLLLATISEHGFCIIDDLCKEIHTHGLALLPIDEQVRIVIACYENAAPHVRATTEKIAVLLRQWYDETYQQTRAQPDR